MLKDIERVRREALDPQRSHQGKNVVDGWALNLLVAFGLRFFRGPLPDRPPEEVIPNFPPGGVFTPRESTRFGIKRRVPMYLRTMNAEGDRLWVGRRLGPVINFVLLAGFFYLVIVPYGVVARQLGAASIRKRPDPGTHSYWTPVKRQATAETYPDLF